MSFKCMEFSKNRSERFKSWHCIDINNVCKCASVKVYGKKGTITAFILVASLLSCVAASVVIVMGCFVLGQ
jgi:L-lactate permease